MKFEHLKTAVLVVWMLAWSVMALSVDVSSASSWIILAAGALPPLMLLRLWRPPAQTMSESIRDVLK